MHVLSSGKRVVGICSLLHVCWVAIVELAWIALLSEMNSVLSKL